MAPLNGAECLLPCQHPPTTLSTSAYYPVNCQLRIHGREQEGTGGTEFLFLLGGAA